MTTAENAQQKIEVYLDRLGADLRGLSPEEIREIVEELRSHILDKASADGRVTAAAVDAALAALGSPDELASAYVTDTVMAQAEVSRSPVEDSEEFLPLGHFEYCRILCAPCLAHRIRDRNQFLPRGPAETAASGHGRSMDLAR